MGKKERDFDMKKVKIAFIGVGNMASAIIGGVAEDGISHSDVILFDRHPVKTAPFKTQGLHRCLLRGQRG